MKYAIEYTITGDNSGTGTYITDNVAEFVSRMRKEYAGRITFSITQLTNPDGRLTSSSSPSGEDHRRAD
jgi:hypothetical protein